MLQNKSSFCLVILVSQLPEDPLLPYSTCIAESAKSLPLGPLLHFGVLVVSHCVHFLSPVACFNGISAFFLMPIINLLASCSSGHAMQRLRGSFGPSPRLSFLVSLLHNLNLHEFQLTAVGNFSHCSLNAKMQHGRDQICFPTSQHF